jgi:uncharacterized protein
MNSMAIDRRTLLIGSLAALPVFQGPRALGDGGPDIAFVSAVKHGDGRYGVLMLGADGRIVREVPLIDRGHDIALHRPSGEAAVFARRPGTFAVAFDLEGRRAPQIFTAIEGRHYYGHGAFSTDGRLLYVSENDIANARGVIGTYDVAAGYKRLGEVPSYGTGPHEIILLSDGRTLAVANGGIDTVPEAGRENLNIETMEPSLVFIDAASGSLRAKHELQPDLRHLSIRHIAADYSGHVWFGGQWEGDFGATPELIGCAGPDKPLRLIHPDKAMGAGLKGYIGSMAVSLDGRTIAASAPKAGRIIYLDATTGAIRGQSDLKDGCGVAGDAGDTFAVTSGLGTFRHETPGATVLSEAQLADIAFDNHLRRFS